MNLKLDKFGSLGAIVAAAACPICFPKLALIGALIGLGALVQYEYYFLVAAQLLVLISLVGVILAFQSHGNLKILIFAIACVMLFFISLYLIVNEYLSYLALAGLVASFIWQLVEAKRCSTLPEAKSIES
jgi:mercuric ion transport protein